MDGLENLEFMRVSSYTFHFISFNIFKEGHPSAMKLIFKRPSNELLTINRKITEKVEIKIRTS